MKSIRVKEIRNETEKLEKIHSNKHQQELRKEILESDHKGMPSPEKERSIASCSDLQMSPIHMQRDEEKLSEQEAASSPVPIAPSPPTFFKCDYWIMGSGPCGLMSGKTFNCKSDLRCHMHEVHGQCLDFHLPNPPPCPLPGCK